MATDSPKLPDSNSGSALGWLASWVAILGIVALLARTSWGKPIVYYTMWLAIAVLILTHSQDFTDILAGKAFS